MALRFALDYQQKYKNGSIGARQGVIPPHYIYYVDGEAIQRGDHLNGTSLSPMFEHRQRVAENHHESKEQTVQLELQTDDLQRSVQRVQPYKLHGRTRSNTTKRDVCRNYFYYNAIEHFVSVLFRVKCFIGDEK